VLTVEPVDGSTRSHSWDVEVDALVGDLFVRGLSPASEGRLCLAWFGTKGFVPLAVAPNLQMPRDHGLGASRPRAHEPATPPAQAAPVERIALRVADGSMVAMVGAGAFAPPIESPPTIRSRNLRAATAAAQQSARIDRGEEDLADLANRARWSAAMPELRLRVTRLVDESESVAPTEYDADRITARGGTSLWLEARGTWKLDCAVFADEEIRVAKLRQELDRERDRVRGRIVALLFEWQRATLALARDAYDPVPCWEAWLQIEQLGSEIDLLTGGWFAEWARRDERRRPSTLCSTP